MQKAKRKNLTTEEISQLTRDKILIENKKRIDRAERIANSILRRLENGRFQVTESGKISITIWGFSLMHPPVWNELQEALSKRGFKYVDYDVAFMPWKFPITFRLE